MATLTFTVKNIYGDPIQGASVEITPYMLQSGLGGTKTTNAEGKASFEYHSIPTSTSSYTITFSKDGYNTKVFEQPGGLPLDREFKLYEDIIKFKLYKYNENTHTEELYTGNIRVEQYTYESGMVAAPSTINPISISNDGYYHIAYENVYPIVQTNTYLFKLTANDLTNYGSIFLLPNGFIAKQVTNWNATPYKIHIVYNSLSDQTMVFYPNAKRLTKAELRKCVVSNPHLMEDGKSDTYCPTNITYHTIYNMVKKIDGADNYISGAEDINFYQNKILTIVNDSTSKRPIRCYINAPGKKQMDNRLIVPGSNIRRKIYYSANVELKVEPDNADYEVANNHQTLLMREDKTVVFRCKMKPYTFVIKRIQLDTEVDDCSTGEFAEFMSAYLSGYWKGSVAPSSAITQNLQIAISITDTIGGGFVSFTDSIKYADGTTATEPLVGIKYESFSETINTGGALNWLNRDDFIVSCVFLSNPDVFWEFEGNNYYTNNAFHPVITSNCSTGGGTTPTPGTSWAGGKYSVAIIPNNNMVRVSATDKNGKNQDFDITSPQTVSANSMNIVGTGKWAYNSPKMTATDSDTLGIPYNGDTSTSNITVRFS